LSIDDPSDKKGAEKASASFERSVQEFETNLKSTVREHDEVENSLEDEIYKCR
jgi:hypothetical protein